MFNVLLKYLFLATFITFVFTNEADTTLDAFKYAIKFKEADEVLQMLQQTPKLLNKIDIVGETPLMYAVELGKVEMVQVLLDQNPNVKHQDKYGITALGIAVAKNFDNIAEMLITKDQTTLEQGDLLHVAVEAKHEEMVKFLLQNNANVNHKNYKSWTPLMIAAEKNLEKIAKCIIDKDKNTINEIDANGLTPLMIAADFNNEEMIKFLLNQNANINDESKKGWTALHFAVKNNFVKIAKILINNNPKSVAEVYQLNQTPSMVGVSKWSPLMIAVQKKNKEMVELLLEHNANPYYETRNGITALTIAEQKDLPDIVKLLITKKPATREQIRFQNLKNILGRMERKL